MKSVGGITSDPLAVSQIYSLTRSVIGDRPSHPIYKVPPPQGLLDEIRQFRMPPRSGSTRRPSHFAGVLIGIGF